MTLYHWDLQYISLMSTCAPVHRQSTIVATASHADHLFACQSIFWWTPSPPASS